jgi:four helix bundle protein
VSNNFKDLLVWQRSYVLAKEVYKLTRELPAAENYGLISQIQRCAISIPSNIAEGQQRSGPKEFKQFLSIAKGSAGELETQLMLAGDIYDLEVAKLLKDIDEIQRMIQALRSKI